MRGDLADEDQASAAAGVDLGEAMPADGPATGGLGVQRSAAFDYQGGPWAVKDLTATPNLVEESYLAG